MSVVNKDNPLFGSAIDRRTFLLNSIANSYTSQLVKSNSSETVDAISQLDIVCDTVNKDGINYCTKCLQNFFSKEIIDEQLQEFAREYKKNRQRAESLPVHRTRTTACSGNCVCDVSNINMNNIVTVNFDSKIGTDKLDIKNIVSDVRSEYKKRYGGANLSNKFEENITNIVINIQSKTEQNINQIVSSTQSVVIKGPGTKVRNIHMDIMINAVMRAIADTSGALDLLNDTVQEQMNYIRKQVNKNIISEFKYVWDSNKWYLIGTGVFVVFLMLLIAFMLIYRAVYGADKF